MVEKGRRLWKQEDGDTGTNGTLETSSLINYQRIFHFWFSLSVAVILPPVKYGRARISGYSCFSGEPTVQAVQVKDLG